MTSPMEDSEWRFILYMCAHNKLECIEELKQQAPLLDLRRLVALSAGQRLLPLISLLIGSIGSELPRGLEHEALHILPLSRYRSEIAGEEAARICRLLTAAGLPVAVTKGVSLAHRCYVDGTRWFNDVDLMLRPRDAVSAVRVLDAAELPVGIVDDATEIPSKLPRADQVIYAMSPDHLPRRILSVNKAGLSAVALDIALSMTWHRSKWTIDIDPFFEQLERVPLADGVTSIPCLPLHAEFMFLVLHLFREAWFERSSRSVACGQFRDLVMVWECLDEVQRSLVSELIRACDLTRPIQWTLAHTEQLLNVSFTELELPPAHPDWLSSSVGRGDTQARWSGDMNRHLYENALPT